MKESVLPPLKWIEKYYSIGSLGVAADTAEKRGGGGDNRNINVSVNG